MPRFSLALPSPRAIECDLGFVPSPGAFRMSPFGRPTRGICARFAAKPLLAAALAGGAAAHAQEQPPPPHERRGDPPAPPRVLRTAPVANVALRMRDAFLSVQVNTTPDGQNVLDDAGNETSLAVDPVRPNRMAIGWRQFDSISSNFREAGFAWSRDG